MVPNTPISGFFFEFQSVEVRTFFTEKCEKDSILQQNNFNENHFQIDRPVSRLSQKVEGQNW